MQCNGWCWWLCVGIVDYLWLMWFFGFDLDVMFEEMGWMDENEGVQNFWGNLEMWFEKRMELYG